MLMGHIAVVTSQARRGARREVLGSAASLDVARAMRMRMNGWHGDEEADDRIV